MLVKPAATLPAGSALPGGTVYEPKWDGYRAILERTREGCRVWSRNGADLTAGFPDIVDAACAQLQPGTVVDGELVVWSEGRLDFAALAPRLAYRPARRRRDPSAQLQGVGRTRCGTRRHRRPPVAGRAQHPPAGAVQPQAGCDHPSRPHGDRRGRGGHRVRARPVAASDPLPPAATGPRRRTDTSYRSAAIGFLAGRRPQHLRASSRGCRQGGARALGR